MLRHLKTHLASLPVAAAGIADIAVPAVEDNPRAAADAAIRKADTDPEAKKQTQFRFVTSPNFQALTRHIEK